ncbi:hypothetical protein B0F87_104211 [Methylobacter tundripaludum]|uniref:Uncharacterized protein n=1 Tax=Methylobacter tundripaludum TaxID=173365 RepID=A0A2S6HF53_9GAMM|nr:hypothetical protein [Methylobacter tundripaludum]PPK76119.1 hypothetical protein B0F87_104211 [Methylobacter tundripaludum]
MSIFKSFLPGKAQVFGRRTFLKHVAVTYTALGTYLLNTRFSLAAALVTTPETLPEIAAQSAVQTTDVLRYHTVIVDGNNEILPWYTPIENAYDHYLDQLWTWLSTVPNGPSSSLPMYYLYCGFQPGNPITPDSYENDWGERIPNFVEFGRLYYAYTGNMAPLNIAKNLADYALAHGMTPSNYAWPNFPYSAANGGATEINGDNVAWNQNDILIDHGSEIGVSFYTLYLVYGTSAYRTAAINVVDTLAGKIQPGSATNSPWPYVVNASTGAVRSRYTSNFAGALTLFDLLIEHGEPKAAAYTTARQTLKNWILQYPMQNGNWVDGHSDVFIDGNTNWSNTTKSNMNLYLLDNPDFDPNFRTDVLRLLQWTEINMVNVNTNDGLSGQYYGASVVAEQFAYMMRMGYQTSRQAAEYAGYYAVTGDQTYKDKAYRGFNYSTYMMQSNGESSDGPTDNVGYWWSDVYGEGPRMFFYGFKAVPEWAPPRENHILYSKTVLKNVAYASASVRYTATDDQGTEYLRLAFLPNVVTVNGEALSLVIDLNAEGYTVRELGNGDYAVALKRARIGDVVISSGGVPITFTIAATAGTGGTITPSGNIVVNQQGNQTFSIAANSGYAIADVNVDGVSVGAVTSYTFTDVTVNHMIAASFSAINNTGGIIGYNGPGTTTDNISDASGCYINATRFLATANLNVTTIKAKILGITGRYKCAIYSDSGGSPWTLLKESTEVTNPTTGWQTFALSSAQNIQNGTYYWLAIWSNVRSASAGIYCDRSGATTRWTNALTYGTWPNPVTTVRGNSYRFCIYAEDLGSSSNSPPTLATVVSANPNPVTGTSTSLSVLGGDDGGEANLSYTWATTGTPPASVTFSANGTNAAKNTIATFTKAGSYSFQVTIKDQGNLTAISSVSITVNQTLTTISVSPASASVAAGATLQFTGTAKDQFTDNLIVPPTFTWNVSGGGVINTSGVFTAGSAAGGPFSVTATSGGKSGTANISVTTGTNILGNNLVGAGNDVSGRNDLNCGRFRATASFTANNMRINLASALTGRMKLAIYADNNGSPGALLMTTNEVINPSSGWVTFNLTSGYAVTSGSYYWLAVWANVNYTPKCQTTGGTARYITRTYGAWPNPLSGTLGPYSNNESIYVSNG